MRPVPSIRRKYQQIAVEQLEAPSPNDILFAASNVPLNDDDIQWIQRRVQHHLETLQQKNSKTRWIDEGYWLTFPIAAIAVFWFRKGWTVRWSSAALAIFFVLLPSDVHPGFSWLNLWLTHDQQGRYYFQKGDYHKASDTFDDPLWRELAFARAGESMTTP